MGNARWRKSSYSGSNTTCVEVAESAAAIAVRDSKHPQAGHLAFGAGERARLASALKAGRREV
jgi:hypothetical protein